jgi:sulfur carrier protein
MKTNTQHIQLTINGEPKAVPLKTTVLDWIRNCKLEGKRVAIERNGEIVPKSQYEQVFLQESDVLEIVVAVGGG